MRTQLSGWPGPLPLQHASELPLPPLSFACYVVYSNQEIIRRTTKQFFFQFDLLQFWPDKIKATVVRLKVFNIIRAELVLFKLAYL